ncbi:hypothetical protein, partial [Streptomyces sp. NRRL F-5193]|uniref:hypothetical protein n=1 Tax=Streptomyces sp. NRRL F-5193 TaxID=1463860 RepID=UPI0005BAFD4D
MFTTKLHLAVEQGQKPMSIVTTAGQRGDSPQFEPVLEKVRAPRTRLGRRRRAGLRSRISTERDRLIFAGQAWSSSA